MTKGPLRDSVLKLLLRVKKRQPFDPSLFTIISALVSLFAHNIAIKIYKDIAIFDLFETYASMPI
jgi:hypothetical protein